MTDRFLFGVHDVERMGVLMAIFRTLAKWSDTVTLRVNAERLYVQSVDAALCGVLELTIGRAWFDVWEWGAVTETATEKKKKEKGKPQAQVQEKEAKEVCVSVRAKYLAMVFRSGGAVRFSGVDMSFADERLCVRCAAPSLVDIGHKKRAREEDTLADYEYEFGCVDADDRPLMDITETKYDVEWETHTAGIHDWLACMRMYQSDVVTFHCLPESFVIYSEPNEIGSLRIPVPLNDATLAYALDEQSDEIKNGFSLRVLFEQCICAAISDVVSIHLIKDGPMRIRYLLEKDGVNHGTIDMHVSPRISDDDDS